jgi:hypothetical protein
MSGHLTREQKNLWKEQVEQSRLSDFNELKLWLKKEGISFDEKVNGIKVKDLFISEFLKVYFDGTPKGYQHNLDGVKKRLLR